MSLPILHGCPPISTVPDAGSCPSVWDFPQSRVRSSAVPPRFFWGEPPEFLVCSVSWNPARGSVPLGFWMDHAWVEWNSRASSFPEILGLKPWYLKQRGTRVRSKRKCEMCFLPSCCFLPA